MGQLWLVMTQWGTWESTGGTKGFTLPLASKRLIKQQDNGPKQYFLFKKSYFFLQRKVLFFVKKSYFFLQTKVLFFTKKSYFFLQKKVTFFCKRKYFFLQKKLLFFAKKSTFFCQKKVLFAPSIIMFSKHLISLCLFST